MQGQKIPTRITCLSLQITWKWLASSLSGLRAVLPTPGLLGRGCTASLCTAHAAVSWGTCLSDASNFMDEITRFLQYCSTSHCMAWMGASYTFKGSVKRPKFVSTEAALALALSSIRFWNGRAIEPSSASLLGPILGAGRLSKSPRPPATRLLIIMLDCR